MGCDIYLFAEKRIDTGWELMPAPRDGYSSSEESAAKEDGSRYNCPHPYRDDVREWPKTDFLRQWFKDRYYYLFGLLAGVRSYDLEPIDDPRGVPGNASPEYKAAVADTDGHSHSWFTVREIRDHFTKLNLSYLTRFCALLDELETYGKAEDIRIVFFFDN